MTSGGSSNNTGYRGDTVRHQGGSADAGMTNTTNQSIGGEQSSTGGDSSSGGTGVGSTSRPQDESNKGNTVHG
ncbi:unnamed protein product [Rotaria sp. Silwood2]|nr:unnamed protein product [Rotaria sp. Silwood2]CAF2749613.1 unnamed protein product [Rotaria sp. Silwood2]CAF2924823.1 unnamed protein product [Rotaria sp. Silwood2]CAF3052943.1 unnamed protein product [Rotaria sp. Silwood2]CAF4323430.1 unnamed protein product [Rotaria sp. Silwood2]